MLTASYIIYSPWHMRDDYVTDATLASSAKSDAPLDFGSIDAPDLIVSGGYYSYEFYSRPGYCCPMPNSIPREAHI
jgi:hypothetical protein